MQFARLLVPALVLTVGAVAHAEDAKTFNLDVKPAYKVGEITTATSHDESTNNTKVATAEGAVAFAQDVKEVVDYTATHKVLEVDGDGHVTKELVHFSEWKQTKGDAASTELTGVHVEVTGTGVKRTWKILTPGVTLATIAEGTKGWLDKKFGGKADSEFGDAMKPGKPVAIGDSWDLSVDKIAEAMGNDMKFDAAKSTAKATLVGVEGDLATVHVEMKLQLVSLPAGPGAVLKVLEGGALEMTGEGHAPLAPTARGDGGAMTMKLSAKTDAPQNMTATIEVEGKQESSTKAGGEMPEVPAAK